MPILLGVFFLSGATALAYQVIWIRLFVLVFGGTVASMSVVVAAFMGGLAIGSRLFGAYAERIANRVRLYGYLELALGTIAFAVFFAIRHLSTLVYALPAGMNANSAAGVFVRLLLSFAILVVPTMIMGGTLPVLIRAVTAERKEIMRNTGLLYAFNTLGAMTGAFLVGFFLIRFFGVTVSTAITVAVNFLLGAAALLLSGRFQSTPDTGQPTEQGEKEPTHGKVPAAKSHGKGKTFETVSVGSAGGTRYLIILTLTGFSALALEMVWMRMMLLTINNTIYLSAIVITIILFGLGLGGLLMPALIPPRLRTARTMGFILSLTALTVLVGFILFPAVTQYGFSDFDFYRTWNRISLLTAAIFSTLGFAPSILMGMSLPIGVGLYAGEVRGLSRRAGVIYACNTAGSLAGSLLSTFLLLPLLGIKGTLIFCMLLFAVPGTLLMLEGRGSGRTALAGVTGVLLFAFIVASALMDIPRSILARNLTPGEAIEYLDEGPSSTIWISSTEGRFRKIWIDNLWVSSTSREGTHNLLAHYPILFHRNPKKIAGIAFGTGQTFGTCLLYPIDKIDCVEIDSRVIKACKGRFDKENYGILDDPRSTIIIDDGRFYMGGTRETYDIVTAEPLQPYTRGTVNLYSYEFYTACKRTLLPGGIVAQWLPLYNSGVRDTWSLIRTFAESFKYVHLFMNASDGIIIGSDQEMKIDPSRPLPEAVKADLARIEDVSVYALAGNYICSRDKLLAASRDYPIITDNHPSLEFTAPISHWNEDTTGPVNMRRKFLTLLEPVEPLFTGTVNWDLAKRFQESRRLLHEGFIREEGDKDISGAYERYLAAYHANPDDIKAIKAVFMTLRKTNRLDLLPPELKEKLMPRGQ